MLINICFLHGLMSASEDDHYEKPDKKLNKIFYWENLYGSLVMCTVIIALAVRLIRIKKFSRFEWTIIICMLLKYSMYALGSNFVFFEWLMTNKMLFTVFLTLYFTLGPICHWTYASQYLKTCFLTRGIVKRAILLYQ